MLLRMRKFLQFKRLQRIGRLNTSFRVNASIPIKDETEAAGRGALLLSELSWTPGRSDNNFVYINGFWGIGQFSSAMRGPSAGGPLGRTGILFEAVGLGRYKSPLSNQASDVAGGGIGSRCFSHWAENSFCSR
ncbi:MAG: hypothetical protein O7E52_03725 [Candidatus Poribacteria bacterium]|nr:hypothetical protein [Candidatus Poribacteria bacterium]